MKTIFFINTSTRLVLLATLVMLFTGCGTTDPSFQLRKATKAGDSARVQQLIAEGADVNYRGALEVNPPVIEAASRNDTSILEILLDHGASANDRNSSAGWTALHAAAASNSLDTANLLIARGAGLDVIDNEGRTPLYIAAENGHKDMIEFLINKGANVNKRDHAGSSPLSASIRHGDKDTIALLALSQQTRSARESYDLDSLDRWLYFHINSHELGVGYQLNPHLGIEGGIYAPLFSSSSNDDCGLQMLASAGSGCDNEEYTSSFNQIAVVGILPVSRSMDHGDLLFKLAMADVSVDYSYSGTSCFLYLCGSRVTGSGSASKINPAYGIGWRTCLSRNSCFRIQYEDFGSIELTRTYSNGKSDTVNHRVTNFMFGLIIYFK